MGVPASLTWLPGVQLVQTAQLKALASAL